MPNSSILSIDWTLSGATTPSQCEPGSDGYEGELCIPQISSIIGASPSDCLMSYQETGWWSSYPSAEMQSVYSTAAATWNGRSDWIFGKKYHPKCLSLFIRYSAKCIFAFWSFLRLKNEANEQIIQCCGLLFVITKTRRLSHLLFC